MEENMGWHKLAKTQRIKFTTLTETWVPKYQEQMLLECSLDITLQHTIMGNQFLLNYIWLNTD